MSRITPVRRPVWARSAIGSSAVVLLAAMAACGPSEEERMSTARAEAWAELEEAQAALNEKRATLASLQAASPGEDADGEALASEVEVLDGEVGAEGEALMTKLVNYINEAAWDPTEERTDEQRAAFTMMSRENMYLAEEYAVKGGDYRRAIQILEGAAVNDPDNAELLEKLAEYQEMRYPSRERLAQVKAGMTEAEVEAVLGKVLHSRVREFSDENVFAWFYAKDPEEHGEGAAAGVFFRESDRKVYRIDPDAIEGRAE